MTPVIQAIHAIQHVVQDHGDKDTHLGSAGVVRDMTWIGHLLGWTWPLTYLEVLGKYNGVVVQDAIVLSFMQSFQSFLVFRDDWHRPDGFWPVGSDGCGNYHVLSFAKRDTNGECPVVTIYHDMPEPVGYADDYPGFVIRQMREQCEPFGCSALVE